MQGNGKISFEIEGVKHSLYFGMTAAEIIAEKTYLHLSKGKIPAMTSVAYIVYGGLCNQADRTDSDRPEYEQAYEIAEHLASDDELGQKVVSCYTESQASKTLLDRLNAGKKKAEENLSQ